MAGIQESNVSRHAMAVTCRVSLYRDEHGGVLEIDDDGRGFDPAGLPGTPGQGTRVRVTIPR